MTKLISRAALAAGAIALGVSGAYAMNLSNTSSMTVSVTVQQACSITTVPTVQFPTLSQNVASGNVTMPETISVSCSNASFNIAADAGLNGSKGDVTSRQLKYHDSVGVDHYILYSLYLSDGVTYWGGYPGTSNGSPIPGTSSTQTYSFKAALLNVIPDAAGTYTDTVTVVITN